VPLFVIVDLSSDEYELVVDAVDIVTLVFRQVPVK
jgi:hypothetical protein